MSGLPQREAAEALEAYLGDPDDPASRLPTARVLAHDEREQFPEELLEPVFAWGFHRYAIPAALGGALRSFEEVYHLTRALARRDLVVANVLGTTLLGSMFTWISGSPEQKKRLAAMVEGRGLAGLALTEEAHGSDSAASEVTAVPVAGGYELSGTKWLINNATRSGALTVLAAVPAGGRRELGLFLVEKARLAPGSLSYLPKLRTVGVRGLDLAGVTFEKTFLDEGARIGSPASSMDTLMRGLYVTRALCAGLSMGTADTALRTTLRFARGRQLYGESVMAIPDARAKLVNALLDLWVCECVTLAALRGVHVAPDQIGVTSAVVKYFVPTTAEAAVRELALVLGARHFVREGEHAVFQKMQRDGSLVSLFDGSTAVNLYLLGSQLDALARGQARGSGADDDARRALFSLDAPLPEFAPAKLKLSSGGRDICVEGLPGALARVERIDEEAAPAIAAALRAILAERSRDDADRLRGRLFCEDPSPREEPRSVERFLRAKRYGVVHAAAACVQVWLHNRESLGAFFGRGRWLALALGRLSAALGQPGGPLPRAWSHEVVDELTRLADEDRMFSIVPTRLAPRERA